MATISGAAVTPAATAATGDPGNLVNNPVAWPATERYPGAVDAAQYTDAGPQYPVQGPPPGPWILDDFAVPLPGLVDGGGMQDSSWATGTDGPQLPWDSAAGAPFAPSGAVSPDLHGADTGAVYAAQHSPPPMIGALKRQTIEAQTWNREYRFEPVQGQWVPAPNGRPNFDQRQVHDPAPGDGGGWAPWDPGYAERPVYNNLAYQAYPVTNGDSPYGVSGALPDRAPFNAYQASAYEAPPDPAVAPQAAAQDGGGGWLLG